MTDATAMIERCGARQAVPQMWCMFLVQTPVEFPPPAGAAYVTTFGGELPPDADVIRARFADAAEALIHLLATPSNVGRADSVDSGPDPQGAADQA